MTIRLGYDNNRGYFFIEMNDAVMLTDGGFNVDDTLELDDYVELIFDSSQPFGMEIYSNEHDFIRYDYRVRIHQSLIHCGENEPAIFSTTCREIARHIAQNITPGTVVPVRLKRMTHREHVWHQLDFEPFRKGLRVYDPPRNA